MHLRRAQHASTQPCVSRVRLRASAPLPPSLLHLEHHHHLNRQAQCCSCIIPGSITCISQLLPRVYCSSLLRFLGSNDLVVVVDGQLMSLERELDGVLGLEDLVEFFELWREMTVRKKARNQGTRFRKLTVLFRVSGRKKYHTTVWIAHQTMKTMYVFHPMLASATGHAN